MLVTKMTVLNKIALILLLFGKFFGLFGVAMGFMDSYHKWGGYFLIVAFVLVKSSIVCTLVQTMRDKEKFSIEDEENKKIKSISEIKRNLEQEIIRLEEKKSALMNLELRRGKV